MNKKQLNEPLVYIEQENELDKMFNAQKKKSILCGLSFRSVIYFIYALVYFLYYFDVIGKRSSQPDCFASETSSYPVQYNLENTNILNVS